MHFISKHIRQAALSFMIDIVSLKETQNTWFCVIWNSENLYNPPWSEAEMWQSKGCSFLHCGQFFEPVCQVTSVLPDIRRRMIHLCRPAKSMYVFQFMFFHLMHIWHWCIENKGQLDNKGIRRNNLLLHKYMYTPILKRVCCMKTDKYRKSR